MRKLRKAKVEWTIHHETKEEEKAMELCVYSLLLLHYSMIDWNEFNW